MSPTTQNDWQTILKQHIEAVDLQIQNWVQAQDPILKPILDYTTQGGKRLRPLLVIAGAQWASPTPPSHHSSEQTPPKNFPTGSVSSSNDLYTIAAALELIHAYSLVHDDLPAMDDDAERRGKPTAHIAFNEAAAILAGDALLTGAFEMLSNIDSPATGLLVQIFSQAAGANGMVAGQMYDLFPPESSAPTLEAFMQCYRLKTGCLFAAALEAGATFSTGHRHAPLKAVGEHLGILFQVRDDIVEAIVDPKLWHDTSTALHLMSEQEWQKWCSNLFQSAAQWTHDPNAVLLNHLIHSIMFADFPDAFKEFTLKEPC